MRRTLFLAVLALATLAPSAAAQQAGPPSEGEVIVRYRAGVDGTERAQVRRAAATRAVRSSPIPRVQLLKVEPGTTSDEAIRELERDPAVLWAERNVRMEASATPNDPRFGELWGLSNTGQGIEAVFGAPDADVDAELAWDLTVGSSGVLVGVVDSGVAYDHPDLQGNIFTNPGEIPGNGLDDDNNGFEDDVRGWDFQDDDNDPRDLNHHGTHVAGTIGAVGNNFQGVAGLTWNTKLLAVRGLDGGGSGSSFNLGNALAYAAGMGARVVNGSFGGAGGQQMLGDAVAAFPETLFVVAAGNAGANNDVTPAYPCNLPHANVICVAATDNNDELADFSNRGVLSVDLGAPGVSTMSTRPHFDQLSSEGFAATAPAGWTLQSPWATTNTKAATGTHSLTDSPAGLYANLADTSATMPAINLAGRVGCHLDFSMAWEIESNFDRLTVERRIGAGAFQAISGDLDGTTFGQFFPLSYYLYADGQSSVDVRFRFRSDVTDTFDGAYIDDVVVRCAGTGYTANDFQFLDGTSMASPHVAGAAALYLARFPGAPVAQIRNALLTTGDPLPTLAGTTVTGRRLNAYMALDPPPATTPPPPPDNPPPPPTPPPSVPPRPTLADVAANACSKSGRGRRTKVSCRLTQAGLIRRVTASIKRRGARRALKTVTVRRLGRRGTLTINVGRALSRGRYVLSFRLTGTNGETRRFSKTVRL
jgi:subtilisin family serine protease